MTALQSHDTVVEPVDQSQLTRRGFLALLSGLAVLAARPASTKEPLPAHGAVAVRDAALLLLRRTDSTPTWFTSANWDNAAYKPWTDYLSGKIDDGEFLLVCARPSDYCLRDIWNLRSETPRKIDWEARTPFNWNGVHALALRFLRTGDDLYLRKWIAVVDDFAAWSGSRGRQGTPSTAAGAPAALLHAAFAWGGIFTALGIIARGLHASGGRRPAPDASPFEAMPEPPTPKELARVPAAPVLALARAFAAGQGQDLVKYYAMPRYVPNQRTFGLEALAQLAVFFPSVPGVAELAAPTHAAMLDAMSRYRLPDGGQLEQSFNYAQDVVFAAARINKLPFGSPPPWREEAMRTVDGWNRLCGALATPTGGLPQVGNALWGRFGRPLAEQRYAATSIAFPYSGYYAMRSEWSPETPYLFFFVRRAARGHSMAGSNSIQLAAFGRQMLIAGGSANYTGHSKTYPASVRYLDEASSFKTNTIVVDGLSQAGGSIQGLPQGPDGKPDITVAPRVPIASRWLASPEFDFAEGLYSAGYKGSLDDVRAGPVTDVTHHRKVVFVRALGLWVVVDLLATTAAHRYTQIWKFAAPSNRMQPPGFTKEQVRLDAAARLIQTTDPGAAAPNLMIRQFGLRGLDYRSYFGEKYGYVAVGPSADAMPATDVHVEWQGEGPQLLLSVLLPHRGPRAAVEASDLSAAGVAGCRLVLPDNGELVVIAATTPRRLELDTLARPSANLLLRLRRPGRPDAVLELGASGGQAGDGRSTFAIQIPSTFHWEAGDDGRLRPIYV